MLDDKKYNSHVNEFSPEKNKKTAATKLKKRIKIMNKMKKDKEKDYVKRKRHDQAAAMHIYLERIEDYDPMDIKEEVESKWEQFETK